MLVFLNSVEVVEVGGKLGADHPPSFPHLLYRVGNIN